MVRFRAAGNVGQRTCQAVDLVDNDRVDLAGLDIGQQSPQRWPLHTAARKATVVVHCGKSNPASRLLALDISLARFALSIERIEVLLEPFLGGLTRVDRAAMTLWLTTVVPTTHSRRHLSWSAYLARRTAGRTSARL
jgi:hypothetical protein